MIKENGDGLIGGEQDDSYWSGGVLRLRDLARRKKGFMDFDSSVVIAGQG